MTTIDVQIAADANDGGIPIGSAYLYIGYYAAHNLHSVFRFTGITIPAGATITAAYISLCAYFSDGGVNGPLRIYANDASAPTFPSSTDDYNGKSVTTAYASWTPSAWEYVTWYDTPSLASVVQELVDSYAPFSSGAMMFFIRNNFTSPNKYIVPVDYAQATDYAAKLHIEYSEATAGNPHYAYAQQ